MNSYLCANIYLLLKMSLINDFTIIFKLMQDNTFKEN